MLRVKLANLKLIIIDEISMMGSKIFEQIHRSLCQVFRTKSEFGGRSVIVFGDFQQLRPVNDNYVFQSLLKKFYQREVKEQQD